MRRTLAAVLPFLLLAPASASAQGTDAPPPLRASLAACGSGPSAEERFAVFTGSMPALVGTRRMAMRFTLQVRDEAGGPWRPVRARGFGRWHRSAPGKGGFVYTKRVERLDQAAVYRAVVRFRWSGASRVQRERTRRSPLCRQPDQRADLRVESLTVLSGDDASTSRYVVSVLNAGRTAAGPFAVGLAGVDREVVRTVAGLPPGERATVELVGPRCRPGQRPSVTLDVQGAVEESDEANNAFERACDGR